MFKFLSKAIAVALVMLAPTVYAADAVTPLPKIVPYEVEGVSIADLQQRSAKGDLAAQTELGLRYARGAGIATDLVKAINLIKASASKGEVTGQYFMGTATLNGAGVTQDTEQAREWFEKAAAQNHIGAQYELGVLVGMDTSGKPADQAAAAKLFTKSAEQGYIPAAFALAQAYQNGRGVKRDYEKAAYWYRRINKTKVDMKAQGALASLLALGQVKAQPGDPDTSVDVQALGTKVK